jgi:hypothetical protein
MNTSLSIFARALASENLSIAFDKNAKTASFDIKNRHLVMPVWDVSETLKTMLVAHEIAHALFTPQAESDLLFAQAEKDGFHVGFLHRICNCIEDVRIEKLMKAKYPGVRRDFFLGYKEIADTDMFKFSEMEFERIGTLNRLNLHFKWGVPGFIDITLHPVEQTIADEIEAVDTFAQVFDLAKRLYNAPEIQDEKQKFVQQQDAGAGDKSGGAPVQNGGDNEDEIVTHRRHGDDILDLPSVLSRKTGNRYESANLNILPLTNYKEQIISTETLLAAYEKRADYDAAYDVMPLDLEGYRKFVRESDAFVRQLVAQFERRKAADEIRRERPKQTGMLNLDRLHQFRTHDDIFLSKIIRQDGKNHGIMFMIDLSGSMAGGLGDCFLQVLQLVWFCEKAKIPFEVYGFTDGVWMDDEKQYAAEQKAWFDDNSPTKQPFKFSKYAQYANDRENALEFGDAKLFQLASSSDSAASRERLLAYLYESLITKRRNRLIRLANTPTVESLILVTQVMQEWVTKNNIQIPTLMIVTDGEPNGIYCKGEYMPCAFCDSNSTLTVTNEILGTVHTFNGAENPQINIANLIVGAMLDSLRTTMNARCVGLFVGPNTLSESHFRQFCVSRNEWEAMNAAYREKNVDHYKTRQTVGNSARYEAARQSYRDNGVILVHESVFPGFDAFFLMRNPKIVNDNEAFASSGNFTKIKNTFVKTMGKRSSSRVFLTKYVDIVAGQPLTRVGQEALYRLPFYSIVRHGK